MEQEVVSVSFPYIQDTSLSLELAQIIQMRFLMILTFATGDP